MSRGAKRKSPGEAWLPEGAVEGLGERIGEALHRSEYSRQEFADILGVSRRVVWCWLTGRSIPRERNLVAMANVFDVSVDELLGFDVATDEDAHGIRVALKPTERNDAGDRWHFGIDVSVPKRTKRKKSRTRKK